MNTLPYTFGGFTFSYEESKIIILPVPYDSTTSYVPGTRFGPKEIIDASRFLEFYDIEEDFEPYTIGIYTMEEIETNKEGPHIFIDELKDMVKKLIRDKKFPIILGGDHSISLAPVRAFAEEGYKFTVIQFDAHSDMREAYEGTKYGHASVGRRILEHTDLIQIGIRSVSKEEMDFIRESQNIHLIKACDFTIEKVKEMLDNVREHVYITLDVDVFDPSVIPSVGTPEPGGLSFKEISDVLKLIVNKKKVIGFDVVELSPIPYLVHPNFTIAKLIYRFIGFLERRGFNG